MEKRIRIKRAIQSFFCIESSYIEVRNVPWLFLFSIARVRSSVSLMTSFSNGIASAGIEWNGFCTKSIPLAFWAAFVRSNLSKRIGKIAIEIFIIAAS